MRVQERWRRGSEINGDEDREGGKGLSALLPHYSWCPINDHLLRLSFTYECVRSSFTLRLQLLGQ